MGFGMRKEVYQRKGKKPFEKRKAVDSKTTVSKDKPKGQADYSGLSEFKKNRFRHFYQTTIFKVSMASMAILVVLLIWLQDDIFLLRQEWYEKNEMLGYYQEQQADFETLKKFHENVGPRLLVLKRVPEAWSFQIVNTKKQEGNNAKRKQYNRPYFYLHIFRVKIEKGELEIVGSRYKGHKSTNNWELDLQVQEADQIEDSVLEYLEVSREEVVEITRILKNNLWIAVDFNGTMRIRHYHKTFGLYDFIFEAPDQQQEDRTSLDEKVHWKRVASS